MSRHITDARVRDVEKRKLPSKHYVYVVHVTWSDGAINIIYRRYSKFFDFHMKVMTAFPEEAGARNPANRSIPFLPGKKVFGRSHTREVATKRMQQIDEYCRILVKLPSKISRCDDLKDFFLPTQEDINPPMLQEGEIKSTSSEIDVISDPIQAEQYTVIADYKKQQRNEVDLVTGETVEVFEKNENGWWFVSVQDSQGWAPGTFLTRADGKEDEEESISGNNEVYITNNIYTAEQDDELTFETGALVTVLRKSLDGWWNVRYQDKEGWVPATYLQKYNGPVVTSPQPTESKVEIVGNVMSISNLGNHNYDDQNDVKPFRQKGGRDLRQFEDYLIPRGDQKRFNTEAKPTPPRRSTVRKSLNKGMNRSGIRRRRPKSEYQTTAAFDASSTQGEAISFEANQTVEVLQQEIEWWYVRINGKEGWAPASYIAVKQTSDLQRDGSAVSVDSETGEQKPPKIGGQGAFKPFTRTDTNLKCRPLPETPSSNKTQANAFGDPRRNLRPAGGPAKTQSKPPALPPKKTINVQSEPGTYNNLDDVKKALKPTSGEQSKGVAPAVKPKTTERRMSSLDENSILVLREELQRTIGNNNSPVNKKTNNSGRYVTIAPYEGVKDEDGLSFDEGVMVEVVEKDESGWWSVRIGSEEGWVPSTYLEAV